MARKLETSFLIQKRDGTIIDLGAEGIAVVTCDPPSASFAHTFDQSAKYGDRLTGVTARGITFPIVFDVLADDVYDYELQRLKVFKIFDGQDYFYLINSRIPYMRYKVVASGFAYPRLTNTWKAKSVSVNLTAYEGFAESTATTQTKFDMNGKDFGFGMGLDEANGFKYTFKNESRFTFHNIGNVPLLADSRPVELTFIGNVDRELKIRNVTTGQTFTWYKPLKRSDTLRLNGVFPLLNGQQRLGSGWSTMSYIDYAVGPNQFEITGATDFEIKFETRFYY